MLFEPIIQRIERTVDSGVSRISGKIIVWIPLLVAVGFATAAASSYAIDRFGPQIGNLALAGAFFVVFLFCLMFVRSKHSQEEAVEVAVEEQAPTPQLEAHPIMALLEQANLGGLEQEVINSLKSMAPDAARAVINQIPRNLHLLAGATIGLFVASRVAKMIER